MTDTHPVHLLVLIHGFWGNPGHLAELDRIIRETKQKQSADVDFEVLVAETNRAPFLASLRVLRNKPRLHR